MKAGIVVVALCVAMSGAQAEIFKWTDAQGQVHYGERPPGGGGAESVTIKEPPLRAPDDEARRTNELNFQRSLDYEQNRRKQERAEAEGERLAREEQCRQARRRLVALESARLLYNVDEAGNRTYHDDAKRRAIIDQVQAAVARTCR